MAADNCPLLNDSFLRLTSRSLETIVCLLLAETRLSHRIKINDSYREMHASNADQNLPMRWCSNFLNTDKMRANRQTRACLWLSGSARG
jgi:hypothetical protein